MSRAGAAVVSLFGSAAYHGRTLLVLGLAAGIVLPDLAVAMKPWLPEMVAVLLFLAALRIGPRQALGAAREFGLTIGSTLVLQVAFPVALLAAFLALGWTGALPTALVLMAAASPISGSPNLTVMSGHDPAPALRLLILGTALLPATVVPVFWLSPALGAVADVLVAAGRLLAIIAVSVAAAFLVRRFVLPDPAPAVLKAVDGCSAVAMALTVIGLMSAVGPAIRSDQALLAINLLVAFGVNFGLQIAVAGLLRRGGWKRMAAPFGIVAGNRNIALFLTALPASVTDPLLLFIGCYQIPMYLTPSLLGGFYRRTASGGPPR